MILLFTMRIQKFLRDMNLGSLRKCDEMVASGQVILNGTLLTNPTAILQNGDTVIVNKKSFVFKIEEKNHYYLRFNKPAEVLCSHSDPYHRKLVFEYLKKGVLEGDERPLFYAGRLDYESRGLMLFSTDGSFIQKITHPSYNQEKEYIVKTIKPILGRLIEEASKGILFEEIEYSPFQYEILDNKKIKFILKEGKKREIRNIIRWTGNEVADLLRVRIADYRLENLKEGEFELFTPSF